MLRMALNPNPLTAYSFELLKIDTQCLKDFACFAQFFIACLQYQLRL